MVFAPEVLLVGAVIGVGILHTIVPDHWVPIALIARQQGWSRRETAQAALQAGTGHVVSTLLIGLIVWIAGVAFATRFGNVVSTVSSFALITFGGWIAITSLRDLRITRPHGHSHSHSHDHRNDSARCVTHEPQSEIRDDTLAVHGPERVRMRTDHGSVVLSIFEAGVPPRFRLTGTAAEAVRVETVRDDGSRQTFPFLDRVGYWESLHDIPEPHRFSVTVSVASGGCIKGYTAEFSEDAHEHRHGHSQRGVHADVRLNHDTDGRDEGSDALYPSNRGRVALLTKHVHAHRHGESPAHVHLHDHGADSWHAVRLELEAQPPVHEHEHRRSARTALLLILGSSPMVEGIPAFFAAGKYGFGLIAVMAIAFGLSTIATYVALTVYSTAGLERATFGSFEKYGEVISGAFIALVGLVFLAFPIW